MNRIAALVSLIAIVGLATTAEAKDPYNQTADLVGKKILAAKYIYGEKFQKKVEFMWLGAGDLWLVDSDGVADVDSPYFGGGQFEWIGEYGHTFRIDNYPVDNGGAVVNGKIFKGTLQVGKFSLTPFKAAIEPASGRWAGELAFPGGLSLPIGFHIADIGQSAFGGGCAFHRAHVQFLGHGYQETDIYICPDEDGGSDNYYFSFFYFDERYGDSWFVSMVADYTVFPSGDLLQATDVSMFDISGSGLSFLGKMLASRPDRFGY